jgi:signal transduction histidine kinase
VNRVTFSWVFLFGLAAQIAVSAHEIRPAASFSLPAQTLLKEVSVFTSPASVVDFGVLSPLQQRWWFNKLVSSLFAGSAVWAHRVRVQNLLQLQHDRMRVATDLHDGLGSNLSRIAILSEVAERGQGEAGDCYKESAPLLVRQLTHLTAKDRQMTFGTRQANTKQSSALPGPSRNNKRGQPSDRV